jgi:hypothetical protein
MFRTLLKATVFGFSIGIMSTSPVFARTGETVTFSNLSPNTSTYLDGHLVLVNDGYTGTNGTYFFSYSNPISFNNNALQPNGALLDIREYSNVTNNAYPFSSPVQPFYVLSLNASDSNWGTNTYNASSPDAIVVNYTNGARQVVTMTPGQTQYKLKANDVSSMNLLNYNGGLSLNNIAIYQNFNAPLPSLQLANTGDYVQTLSAPIGQTGPVSGTFDGLNVSGYYTSITQAQYNHMAGVTVDTNNPDAYNPAADNGLSSNGALLIQAETALVNPAGAMDVWGLGFTYTPSALNYPITNQDAYMIVDYANGTTSQVDLPTSLFDSIYTDQYSAATNWTDMFDSQLINVTGIQLYSNSANFVLTEVLYTPYATQQFADVNNDGSPIDGSSGNSGNGSNNSSSNNNETDVPEAATFAMFVLSVISLGIVKRRFRHGTFSHSL